MLGWLAGHWTRSSGWRFQRKVCNCQSAVAKIGLLSMQANLVWKSFVAANEAKAVSPGRAARFCCCCCCCLYSSALPALRLAERVWKCGCWKSMFPELCVDDERDISFKNIGPGGRCDAVCASCIDPCIDPWCRPRSPPTDRPAPAYIPWSRLDVLKSGWASADAILCHKRMSNSRSSKGYSQVMVRLEVNRSCRRFT